METNMAAAFETDNIFFVYSPADTNTDTTYVTGKCMFGKSMYDFLL